MRTTMTLRDVKHTLENLGFTGGNGRATDGNSFANSAFE